MSSARRFLADRRLAVLLLCGLLPSCLIAGQALALHPENSHYFLFRGRPTLVITSGEHYGSVLNLDFDFVKYLETLKADGLNGTRTWSGVYCEPTTAFNIAKNTLAPQTGRFLSPWARSQQPGYSNGGNKFDLDTWDQAYFTRLNDFLSNASQRGIIVEFNLFCPFYEESMWQLSPMNALNNVNGVGTLARTNVYTLDRNGGLLAVQDKLVRKLVNELKAFDNLYYEICNEPYFGGVTMEWQHHIADMISQTERALGARHLISQNVANYKAKVENPHPAVSIFNFHYATPPDTVELNYGLNKVLGDNETGFGGTNDSPYRMEGWDFVVAGGGLFNNLDYSFTAGHEDGTFVFPASQPGAGSPTLRRQYHFLSQLISRFDFIHMRPQNEVVKAELPAGVTVRALVKKEQDYLIYVRTAAGEKKQEQVQLKTKFAPGELSLEVTLSPGEYEAEWLDTRSSSSLQREHFEQTSDKRRMPNPGFEEDIALTIRKSKGGK